MYGEFGGVGCASGLGAGAREGREEAGEEEGEEGVVLVVLVRGKALEMVDVRLIWCMGRMF